MATSQIPERITEHNYYVIIRGLDQAQLRRWACQCVRRQIWHLLDEEGKEAARFIEADMQEEESRLAWIAWAQRYVERAGRQSGSYYHAAAKIEAVTALTHLLKRAVHRSTLRVATAVAWDGAQKHATTAHCVSSIWNAIWQQARTAQFEILEEIVNNVSNTGTDNRV